ncbi:MAG: GntR family transcriptional regulator [Devosia sp.]
MDKVTPPDPGVSATQKVVDALRKMIVTGEIAPGAKLKIEDLKATLETGASPIREALSLLTSDQLVERIDQRGFRAAPASRAHFEEILVLRCHLEGLALRRSLERAGRAWEETVVLRHHDLSRTPRKDTEAFEARHKAFHMALIAACEAPILLGFCNKLYDLNIRYRYLAGRSISYGRRDIAREHAEIMTAAVDRDVDTAVSRLLHHYERTGSFLAEALD